MLLIVVDSYIKWPEVVIQNSTTSEATVNALRTIFSRGEFLTLWYRTMVHRSSRTSWTGWECCTNLHRHNIQVLMGKQSDLCKLDKFPGI